MSETGTVTVRFRVEGDSSGSSLVGADRMAARPVGGDHYRLTDHPLHALGVARADIVEALPDAEGRLWATSVVEHGGHLALRVLPAAGHLDALTDRLAGLPVAQRRSADGQVVALDVPPDADLAAVKAVLDAGAHDGHWTYHESLVSDAWHALP